MSRLNAILAFLFAFTLLTPAFAGDDCRRRDGRYSSRSSYREGRSARYNERDAYVNRYDRYRDGNYRDERSVGKSVAIVGGSTGAGAAIGALTGGGKGAALGAIIGGTAGFIYDQQTRNPRRR